MQSRNGQGKLFRRIKYLRAKFSNTILNQKITNFITGKEMEFKKVYIYAN